MPIIYMQKTRKNKKLRKIKFRRRKVLRKTTKRKKTTKKGGSGWMEMLGNMFNLDRMQEKQDIQKSSNDSNISVSNHSKLPKANKSSSQIQTATKVNGNEMNQTIPVVEAQYPQTSTILNNNLQHFINTHKNKANAMKQIELLGYYYK